jgi:16S rRNA (cytosine967-C5)-methyltransferase
MSKNKKSSSQPVEASQQSRKVALNMLLAVLKDGQSLSMLNHLGEHLLPRDAAFARMISFGVLRFYQQLEAQLKPLMKKSLKAKDLDVQLVMLMALYQIQYMRVPDYAVVDGAVKYIRKSKKQWAASMVNAVLRNFIRQQEAAAERESVGVESNSIQQADEAKYSHPQWMIDRLREDWPDSWRQILLANNQQAPMTLRINQQKKTADEYSEVLSGYDIGSAKLDDMPAALILDEARDVKQLPGFEEGWFSVQDAGAQLAAQILQPDENDRILDACAAPGGKTAHMFELQPSIQVTALDISESRLERVQENCQRLDFSPELIVADAIATEDWWSGELYDKILLDVPCSASGVIRRHPDIKHLRRDEDIDVLQQTQREILLKNWLLLKPGGKLLYATCSMFKAENEKQIEWFLDSCKDARLVEVSPVSETASQVKSPVASLGIQLFPMKQTNDGFYYALLQKSAE